MFEKYKAILKKGWLELGFQLLLHAMVFTFYAFDHVKHHKLQVQVDPFEVVFFLNYAFAALIINYVLLPRFLYRKKMVPFFVGVVVLIAFVIVMEEGVLEQIFFPDTRGSSFPGVVYNLLNALPTITILTGFKFAWDAITQQRQLEQLQMAVKESELQYLKSQINPHFLFNNLNNLYAYALEQSPKTPEIIIELSGVLRYMLYECKEAYVPLQKELEQLENFVNLSQLQFEERGEVSFAQHNITSGYKIAPLILSVFVENAFKHSSSSQSDNIKIDIAVTLNNKGVLHFRCANSYSSQSNTHDLSKGIGLENVKKRLELLYPHSHTLAFEVTDEMYGATLTLELQKDEV